MPAIWTIGYESADLSDFLGTLKKVGIKCLIDVREIAISRRKGFAKKALSSALEEVGIRYVHLSGLGDPKPGREAARAGDYETFKKIYSKHIATTEAKQALKAAREIIENSATCLMCFERDPFECHRKIVADRISNVLQLPVKHLGVQGSARVTAK